MNRISICVAAFALAAAFHRSLPAQPILNRVEQLVRDQLSAVNPPGTGGAVEPGYLGLTADDRQEQGRGVRIVDLAPAGPADHGGLRSKDLITSINGQPIQIMDDVARVLERMPAGSRLAITVNREGTQREQQVTLGRRPEGAMVGRIPESLPQPTAQSEHGQSNPGPKLGVRTIAVTPEVARENQMTENRGAHVASVVEGSPADQAGIPVGAVITGVDGQPVETPHELALAVQRVAGNRQFHVTYRNGGQETKQLVQLAGDPTRLEMGGRPATPMPPTPDGGDGLTTLTGAGDSERVKALEARIQELQARIEKLEAAQNGER